MDAILVWILSYCLHYLMTLLIEDLFRWGALLHQNISTCLIAWRLLSTLGLILFLFSGNHFFVIQFDPDISVCSLTQKCLHLHEVIACSLTAADGQCINPSSCSSFSSLLFFLLIMQYHYSIKYMILCTIKRWFKYGDQQI